MANGVIKNQYVEAVQSIDDLIPLRIIRKGKLCLVKARYGNIKETITHGVSTQIGVIDSILRPAQFQYYGVFLTNINGVSLGSAFIEINASNGVIKIVTEKDIPKTAVFFSFVYEMDY